MQSYIMTYYWLLLKRVPSPICPCGEAEQSAQHVLQECRLFEAERERHMASAHLSAGMQSVPG